MKLISGRYGYAQASDLYRALGTNRLPAEGMPERLIDGVRVYVKPLPDGPPKRRQSLRVTAICDDCGRHLAAGRLHQHTCTEVGKKSEARRQEIMAKREQRRRDNPQP